MKIEYTMTAKQAELLYKEYTKISPVHRRKQRMIIGIAIALAILISLFVNLFPVDPENVQLRWLITIFIQIPLLVILFYLLHLFILVVYAMIYGSTYSLLPVDYWGHRVVEIGDGQIAIHDHWWKRIYSASAVDEIKALRRGYHFLHQGVLLFSIPRDACAEEELRKALSS